MTRLRPPARYGVLAVKAREAVPFLVALRGVGALGLRRSSISEECSPPSGKLPAANVRRRKRVLNRVRLRREGVLELRPVGQVHVVVVVDVQEAALAQRVRGVDAVSVEEIDAA